MAAAITSSALVRGVLAVAERPRLRVGAIDFAKTGRVFWHDDEPERPRIRIVRVTEADI
jgi:hypothetical protein